MSNNETNNETNNEAQDTSNCGKSKTAGCRKRGGRRLLLGIFGIGALGILAAGSAMAGGGSGECGFGSKMAPTAKAAFVAERIAERSGATEDQQDEIEDVLVDLFSEVTELKNEKEEFRSRAQEILTADSVDVDALQSLRAEGMKTAEEASIQATEALAKVASVLTAEQRGDLSDEWDTLRGRWTR